MFEAYRVTSLIITPSQVFEADLDTREHASHWTLQGAALVLNSDY